MATYRLGNPNGVYPIYSGAGAAKYPGRWNSAGFRVIYTAERYSTALLETLILVNFILPKSMHWIGVCIPAGTSYEVFPTTESAAGRSAGRSAGRGASERFCKSYGDAWFKGRRSALLFVPSIAAHIERNVLINPDHPDAMSFAPSPPEPVVWGGRLFSP